MFSASMGRYTTLLFANKYAGGGIFIVVNMKYKIKTLQKKTFVIFPSKLNLAPGIGLPRV